MSCQEIINYIIIPLCVSFLSAFLIWLFAQLYSFNARQKIHHLLVVLRDECVAFEKYLKYKDYDNALLISRRLMDKTYEILILIKPFNYFSLRKKSLMRTLLANIYLMCYHFVGREIGYDNEQEKEVCCYDSYREISLIEFKATPNELKHPNPSNFQPRASISAKILIELNSFRVKKLNYILKNTFAFNEYPVSVENLKKYYFDLIDINLFKDKITKDVSKDFLLTIKTIKKSKYDKIINKLKKAKKE